MHLRLATSADQSAILDIYNREVAETSNTFDILPRTRKEQRRWFRSHSGVYASVVAEDSKLGIIGFGSLSPYRERAAYIGTAEVSIYIHANHRGKGVGQGLLAFVEELATQHGFRTLIARIAEANQASHKLFLKAGFFLVGVERQVGRKFNRWLDCAIYQKILAGGDSPADVEGPADRDSPAGRDSAVVENSETSDNLEFS